MHYLRTQIEIQASAETVWRVLTDFDRYPQWNPFIQKAEGEVREGARLTIDLHPPGGKAMTFKPTVTKVIPNEEFRWLGRLFVPGLFDGEHIFELEPLNENRTRLVQRENFKGLLVPLLWNSLDTHTRQGFHAMNAALKAEAEE